MSSIDQYQPCVCGSGKKFKFCKCGAVDQVPELEKILRLMDGEQDLAALDRINSLLQKIPNASWLLALKGELTLSMQEYQSFAETTNRFLKLKPDNPLALIFQSIAAAIQEEPIEVQAKYLLDGMAESRENLSSHALFAVHSLVSRLRESDSVGLIGMWGELHEKATSQQPSQSVLRDPMIHLACKSASRIIESPTAAWTERLNEVVALASAFRFEQAEKKLQSILRDYPGQAEPLSHLLRAQVAQVERTQAIATANKLADLNTLSAEDRAYFRVLAWEYEQTPLKCPATVKFGEIESDETLIEALSKLDGAQADDMDQSKAFMGMMIGDEVPAKRVFQIFHSTDTPSGKLKSFVGIVAVYGKQTDKPARAILLATDYPGYRAQIDEVVAMLHVTRDIEDVPDYTQPYVDFLNRNRFIDNPEAPWVSIEERGRQLVEDFLSLPQKVLDGQTPLEAAGDERKRANLLALLLHLEGSTAVVVPATAIEEIYRRLQLDVPAKTSVAADDSQFSLASYLELLRIDLSTVSNSLLVGITQLALSKGATRLLYELANEIVRRSDQPNMDRGLSVAYSILLDIDPDANSKLKYAEKMEELLAAAKQPVGRYVLLRADLYHQLGRDDAAKEHMLNSLKKYPQDPELTAFFQRFQAMAQMEARPGDLASKMVSTAAERQAAKESGGLVLPGQAAPAQSESKLWLPGT